MKTFIKCNALALCVLAIALVMATNVPLALAQVQCNSVGTTTTTTGSIAASDTAQTGRLFRDGRNSTCTFSRAIVTSAGSYNSDQYSFTNTSGGPICVNVDLDATGCGVATNQISMAAYLTTYNPASPAVGVIGDPGLSTGGNFASSMTFSVPAGATYIIVVHNINAATTCASYTFRRTETQNCRAAGYDAANDGSSDLALFRSTGSPAFYSLPISGSAVTTTFGSAGDIPVPADYNGDQKTDVAVFRPSTGTWFTSTNPATNYGAVQFGASGDIPVQGNYDRDDITDLAVYRPSTGVWYILRSSDSTAQAFTFGGGSDKPVPADYDGDGRTDLAIYRPSDGTWQINGSFGNYFVQSRTQTFGISTDVPVPADYDGDSKADLAVFRASDNGWYIFRSSVTTGQTQFVPFGTTGDIPQAADFDGDRKADQAVFRPSNGTWYVLRSTTGAIGVQFGQNGDQPVSTASLRP